MSHSEPPETSLLDMAEWLNGDDVALTQWEEGFIKSALDTLRVNETLSPKQREKLEDMYYEHQAAREFNDACDEDD
jgi:hypothetical protein